MDTRGYVDLRTRLGTWRDSEEKRVRFLLVEANTSYTVLLGQSCLNAFRAIISTPHLTMKYPFGKGTICTVRVYQRTARKCYDVGLKMFPQIVRRKNNRSGVVMVDLDLRTNIEDRLEPLGETQPVLVGKNDSQTTTMAKRC